MRLNFKNNSCNFLLRPPRYVPGYKAISNIFGGRQGQLMRIFILTNKVHKHEEPIIWENAFMEI